MGYIKTGDRDLSYREKSPSVEDRESHVHIKDASDDAVMTVLGADPQADAGYARSQWVWVRFPNGDLMLATFPQDETYFATENDH